MSPRNPQTESSSESRIRLTWAQYWIAAWFNVGEVLIGLVAFLTCIVAMFSAGHGLDPLDVARDLHPTVSRALLTVCVISGALGPLALFDSVSTGRLPFPYRWAGARLLPRDKIIFPWQP